MSDSDVFGENPFRSLAAGKFSDKDKKYPPGKNSSKNRSGRVNGIKLHKKQPTKADDGQDAEECTLFLNAVGQVAPTGTGSGKKKAKKVEHSGTFLLEEHWSLPDNKGTNKKNDSATCPVAQKNSCIPEKNPRQDREPEKFFMKKHAGKSARAYKDQGACKDTGAAATHPSGNEDEDAIFMQAMGQVQALQGRGRDIAPAPEAANPPPQGHLSLQDFLEGKLEFALSFTDEYIEGHVVGLDQMIMNKLRAGSLSPEGHLDLHGLNAVQAFEALRGFLRGSWYKGLRTVLVVSGRGRNSPDGIGILREKLQLWLTQEPLKRVVLAFCTAQAHDGGPGSVYVLLRKYRKKGRIYWERLPADSDLY